MMLRARLREAAEHDELDLAWRRFDCSDDGGGRDPRRAVWRKPVDAGRDRRKCDRAQAMLGGKCQGCAITGSQQRVLVVVAPAPDRADRMNDVLRLEGVAACDLG